MKKIKMCCGGMEKAIHDGIIFANQLCGGGGLIKDIHASYCFFCGAKIELEDENPHHHDMKSMVSHSFGAEQEPPKKIEKIAYDKIRGTDFNTLLHIFFEKQNEIIDSLNGEL